MRWLITVAVHEPRAVAAAVNRNRALAVITTTVALARLGDVVTAWLIDQVSKAGDVLYASVIRGKVSSDATVVLPAIAGTPPSSLGGIAA